MSGRKQHVINMAHQLFVEKGFQATSIQDILDKSGISKGTFYNYFSSKNELLIELFKTVYKKLEKERNELLVGQDPANIEIFIEQVKLQLKTNRANKLVSLFEEVIISNDEELKQFLKAGRLKMLYWLYNRFIDIFGESKKPYLLDCTIMFVGILHHNLKFYSLVHESTVSIHQVVRYSMDRIIHIVEEVSETGDQLISPEWLQFLVPDCINNDQEFQQKVINTLLTLKQSLTQHEERLKYMELLDFIQTELLHSKKPRKYLIESALLSLQQDNPTQEKELNELQHLVAGYFNKEEERF